MKNKTINNLLYHAISIFMSLLGRVPESAGNRAGDILGTLWFAFDKKHRKLTCSNIKLAYGTKKNYREVRILARNVFKNTARMLFEHTRFHRMNPEHFSDVFSIKGLDNLITAHDRGKGVLLYSGHLGNWELLLLIPYITRLKFCVVYKTVKFAPMDRYIMAKREFSGNCDMIPLHNALDKVKASLKRGEIIGLAVDQNTRKRDRGVFIDFFNRKACVQKGFASLAVSTKAPVVPLFTYRENNKTYIEILPQIPLIQTNDEQQDIFDNTQVFHSIIEKYVRKYPDQYFWMHNKWKTRPLDEL